MLEQSPVPVVEAVSSDSEEEISTISLETHLPSGNPEVIGLEFDNISEISEKGKTEFHFIVIYIGRASY